MTTDASIGQTRIVGIKTIRRVYINISTATLIRLTPSIRVERLVVERWPGQGKIVFNTAYDDAGNRVVDEWTEYDSDGNVIEYWDLIALEAEARKAIEQANTD